MDEVNAKSLAPSLTSKETQIEAEVGKELKGAQAHLNEELASLYANSDEKVAEIMRDLSLSEEDRRAKVAQIEAEAHTKAREIFAGQRHMREREAALEAQLARYSTQVAQAEAAALEAQAAGPLSPDAFHVTSQLQDANARLKQIRQHPIF